MTTLCASIVCDRVRLQISLELDGELSQVERAMLRAHLRRCADCRSFERAATAFTAELRAVLPERPGRPVVVSRLAAGRWSWATQRLAQVGVAAMVIVGALGLASQLRPGELQQARTSPPITKNLFKAGWQPEEELALLVSNNALQRPYHHSTGLFDSI